MTKIEILRKFWPKSKFFRNFDRIRNFSKYRKNQNYSKFWPNSKFIENLTEIGSLKILEKIEIFRYIEKNRNCSKIWPKSKIFANFTEFEIFGNFQKFWPHSNYFFENFDQNRDFFEDLIRIEDFPKFWPKTKFFEILEKIEIIRKFD